MKLPIVLKVIHLEYFSPNKNPCAYLFYYFGLSLFFKLNFASLLLTLNSLNFVRAKKWHIEVQIPSGDKTKLKLSTFSLPSFIPQVALVAIS